MNNNKQLFSSDIERIIGASWPTDEARKACDEVFEYHGNHSPYAAYVQGFVDGINYGLQNDVGQRNPKYSDAEARR